MDIIIRDMRRDGGIASIVKARNGMYYCVDTADTFDMGPETMVFRYVMSQNRVKGWDNPLITRHYKCMDDALKGHAEIAYNLSEYIGI